MGRLFNEPVLIGAAIRAVIYAAMAFGLQMTTEQLGALMAAVEAILALVTRALVTPNQLAEARVAEGLSPTQPRGTTGGPPPMPVVLLAAALSLGALSLPACAGNRPPETDPTRNLSVEGKAAYHAKRVIDVLDLLRDTAAAAELQTPKLLSPANALKVIDYHKKVVTVIDKVPSGWKGVALAGLDQLQQSIPADEWARLAPYATLIRTLVEAFAPGSGLDPPVDTFGWLGDVPVIIPMTGGGPCPASM